MSDKGTEHVDFADILSQLDQIRGNLDMDCEKLQVALTGVFRLLGGRKSELLKGLGGQQEDLEAYTLKLISELRKNSNDQLLLLKKKLEVMQSVADDRKP